MAGPVWRDKAFEAYLQHEFEDDLKVSRKRNELWKAGNKRGKDLTCAQKGKVIEKAVSEGFAKEGADLYLVGHQDREGLNEVMENCKSLWAKTYSFLGNQSRTVG
jgi:hypothetical protein